MYSVHEAMRESFSRRFDSKNQTYRYDYGSISVSDSRSEYLMCTSWDRIFKIAFIILLAYARIRHYCLIEQINPFRMSGPIMYRNLNLKERKKKPFQNRQNSFTYRKNSEEKAKRIVNER